MLRRFIKFYKPHKKLFTLDMLASLLIAVGDLVFPMFTRKIVNEFVPDKNVRYIIIFAAILLSLYIFKALLNYFVQYYGHVVGVRMQGDMRRQIFSKLQKLPFSFYDENKTGVIMSRIINDLMDISELAHHGPENLFLSSVMIIGSFVLLCTVNLPLTLIIFAFLPFLIIFTMKKRKKLTNAFRVTREKVGEINAGLENSISGIRVSKAFNNAEYEEEKFEVQNNAFIGARKKAYKVMAEFHSGSTLILDIMNVVVIVAAGLFTIFGKINIGDFTAYLLFINVFLSPVKTLVNFMEQFQNGMTGFKRYTELVDEQEEIEDKNAVDIGRAKGEIKFTDVCFTYEEGKEILSNINLTINKGKTVALVGPSGGGKTTLCHLIPRFYNVDSGIITIDGVDVTKISYQSLRENIGIVQQDVFLFTGTIYENIAYGRLDATKEEVYSAAKSANLHEYIMSLPDGYETYIGERGIKLSGGQKQRISIARVFLKNPAILILDEATSALDNTTEQMIQDSLNELCKGRTTLVVAHRLSTIRNADEIIVLTENGIEERGTHTELMAKNGVYAMLNKHIAKQEV